MPRWSLLPALLLGCSAPLPPQPSAPAASAPAAPPAAEAASAPPPALSGQGWSAYEREGLMAEAMASASSEFPGWPASNATDGDPTTAWFSANGDSAARGARPYLRLSLGRPRSVRRVTVLGNRTTAYPRGYSVLEGRLLLLDARTNVLHSVDQKGKGELHDFDFSLSSPVEDVTDVYFVSVRDEGDRNPYADIAVSEVRVE